MKENIEKQIVDLYFNQGWCYNSIMEKFNLTYAQVKSIINKVYDNYGKTFNG